MICPFCGKDIPNGSSMCPECSCSIPPQSPIRSSISTTSSGGNSGIAGIADKLKGIPARLVAKIAFLIAILCFVFPFVTISCDASDAVNSFSDTEDEYSFEVTYKGYNFIFPSTIDEDNAKVSSGWDNNSSSSSYDDDESSSSSDSDDNGSRDVSKEDPDKRLIGVVICCIVGCTLLFIKKFDWMPAVSAVLSFAGIILLSRFKSTFADKYLEMDGASGFSIENFLDIDFRFGYSLCMLFLIISLIASAITFLTEKFQYDRQF